MVVVFGDIMVCFPPMHKVDDNSRTNYYPPDTSSYINGCTRKKHIPGVFYIYTSPRGRRKEKKNGAALAIMLEMKTNYVFILLCTYQVARLDCYFVRN